MSSDQQTRLSKCVAYLQRKQLFECANAVAKAAGQVNCYQLRKPVRNKFSHAVNSALCEALIVMNSDIHCDTRNRDHVRSLIEAYRDMNGMSPLPDDDPDYGYEYEDEYDEYEDAGLDYSDGEEYDEFEDGYEDGTEMEFEVPADGEDVVIGLETDGVIEDEGEYDINEVDDETVEECILGMVERGGYLSYEDICSQMAECREDEEQIMNALKELVRRGDFEVTSRNPYTGEIDMVMALR